MTMQCTPCVQERIKKIVTHLRENQYGQTPILTAARHKGHLYVKTWLIDDTRNRNGWRVSWPSIKKYAKSYIGMPGIAKKVCGRNGCLLDHTYGATEKEALQKQEAHRVSTITDIIFEESEHAAYAIHRIDDPAFAQKIENNEIRYLSPGIWPHGEHTTRKFVMPQGDWYIDTTKWKGMHDAFVDIPAYGGKASVRAMCRGGPACRSQLHNHGSIYEPLVARLFRIYDAIFTASGGKGVQFQPDPGEKPDKNGLYWRTIGGKKIPFKPGSNWRDTIKHHANQDTRWGKSLPETKEDRMKKATKLYKNFEGDEDADAYSKAAQMQETAQQEQLRSQHAQEDEADEFATTYKTETGFELPGGQVSPDVRESIIAEYTDRFDLDSGDEFEDDSNWYEMMMSLEAEADNKDASMDEKNNLQDVIDVLYSHRYEKATEIQRGTTLDELFSMRGSKYLSTSILGNNDLANPKYDLPTDKNTFKYWTVSDQVAKEFASWDDGPSVDRYPVILRVDKEAIEKHLIATGYTLDYDDSESTFGQSNVEIDTPQGRLWFHEFDVRLPDNSVDLESLGDAVSASVLVRNAKERDLIQPLLDELPFNVYVDLEESADYPGWAEQDVSALQKMIPSDYMDSWQEIDEHIGGKFDNPDWFNDEKLRNSEEANKHLNSAIQELFGDEAGSKTHSLYTQHIEEQERYFENNLEHWKSESERYQKARGDR